MKDLDCVTINNALCDPIEDVLSELAKYKEMVVQILDMESIEKGEFLVKSTFDEQLGELKSDIDKLEAKMHKVHSKAIADLGLESVKLDCVSHLGYHFRVTLRDEACLRKNKNYRIIDALKGGARFTNDALESLNIDFMKARDDYEEQQQTIVDEVIGVASGYLGSFTRLNSYVAELDCYLSFAIAAVSAPTPYVKPKMSDASPRVLSLKGMRHPCLELQEDVTFIANDVDFKDDETNMYIITGINYYLWLNCMDKSIGLIYICICCD